MISRLRHVHISKQFAGWLVLLFASMLIVSAASASSEQDPYPRIEGQRLMTADRIIHILGSAGWDDGKRSEALQALHKVYYMEGYLFASTRLEKRGSDTVLIIEEGEPARFGVSRLHGAKTMGEEEAIRLLGIAQGSRFIPRELDKRIGDLLEHYDELGFPFAQVWIDSVGMEAQGTDIAIVVFIVEGGKKRLAKINVTGLTKTKPDLVVDLSGLEVGEPYDGRILEDAYLRLQSSGIFEDVSYPRIKLSTESEGVEAFFVLKEPQRHNSLASALGYAKREGSDDEVLSGMVRLNLLNIGGTLRDLNIYWNNDGAGKNELKLAYKDRFIVGKNLSLGTDAGTDRAGHTVYMAIRRR
jgi:outer membrane protein assembly factor BamA